MELTNETDFLIQHVKLERKWLEFSSKIWSVFHINTSALKFMNWMHFLKETLLKCIEIILNFRFQFFILLVQFIGKVLNVFCLGGNIKEILILFSFVVWNSFFNDSKHLLKFIKFQVNQEIQYKSENAAAVFKKIAS